MLLPLSWLKEYITSLPAAGKLAEVLMMHGLEVESMTSGVDQDFKNVVVGQITAIRPHPHADKLRLADVVVKTGDKPQEIVCGAPNIEVGQKVAVALLGAKLPNGLTIAKRTIRGVESNGMICAEDELGLGSNHAGIMVLDPSAKLGTPLAKVLGSGDTVFDLAIPANRADLMAVRGLAWEIGAILGKAVKIRPAKLTEGKIPASTSLSIIIAQPKLCSIYTARVIRGVTVKSSPAWLQSRLRAAGMRPINVVVDATNYVMLEYGQPLHAFDAGTMPAGEIFVRSAKDGETLVTLDGQRRRLDRSMLVIADAGEPIALAGVMGGEATEVSDKTTDIILEAAIFDPVSIRRTSRQLGLVSEASKRFEKGLWPSLPERASAAAAAMIIELSGGTVEKGRVRAGKAETKATTISINPKYISERLGQTVPPAKSKAILKKLGFGVSGATKWKVTVPEWRIDVTNTDDIVDEIGRLIGYEGLPKSMPPLKETPGPLPALLEWKDQIRNALVGLGFTEMITHSYYGERARAMLKGEHIEVANPLDANQHYLRRSLIPALSKVLEAAVDAGKDIRVFEISRIFNPVSSDDLPRAQPWKLALGVSIKPPEGYVHGRSLRMFGDEMVAALNGTGTFNPETFLAVGQLSKGRVMELAELDISTLLKSPKSRGATTMAKYPPITRDIAFWWPKDEVLIQKTIKDLSLSLLQGFSLKDKFSKEGKVSYAYTFIYQSPDRTLTKAEVDALEEKIKDALTALGAVIR